MRSKYTCSLLIALLLSGNIWGQFPKPLLHATNELRPVDIVQAAGIEAETPPTAVPQQFGGMPTEAECPCCRCSPCECPQHPAPCIECPHVSTIQPFWNVRIFGALQGNMLFNTARPVAPGIPLFLLPETNQPENTVDIFARSSSIGALISGPQVGEFQTGGLILAAFYNDALIVDRYGILPMQALGELRNEDWRFAAGLQFNVFNPVAPNMLTFGLMLGSGNSGNNFPGQFRIERFLYPSDDSQWTIQFALSDPIATGVITNSPISQIITGAPALRVTEDNGWPSLEGRIAYSVGDLTQVGLEQKRALEIGASVVGSQFRTAIPFNPNIVANSYGMGADFRWRLNDRWGVQGETFVGEGLGYLNGGSLQSTNSVTFSSIRSRGSWGEVYYYLTPCLHTHCGGGVDDPIDGDLATGQITLNETTFANLIWDVTKQFRLGFEFTWRKTNYIGLPNNEGTGYHTQVQWSF